MNKLKMLILKIVSCFIGIIEHWKLPWTKSILNAEQILDIQAKARPGDILLVRAGGYFSTFLFGLFGIGKYTHVVYVEDKNTIVDATGAGVTRRPLLGTLIGYTRAAILRVDFSDNEELRSRDKLHDIMKLVEEKGIGYNYTLVEPIFKDGNNKPVPDTLTCAQLIRLILNAGRKDFMGLRPRFGFLSVTPQDYFNAKRKFELVAEYE